MAHTITSIDPMAEGQRLGRKLNLNIRIGYFDAALEVASNPKTNPYPVSDMEAQPSLVELAKAPVGLSRIASYSRVMENIIERMKERATTPAGREQYHAVLEQAHEAARPGPADSFGNLHYLRTIQLCNTALTPL